MGVDVGRGEALQPGGKQRVAQDQESRGGGKGVKKNGDCTVAGTGGVDRKGRIPRRRESMTLVSLRDRLDRLEEAVRLVGKATAWTASQERRGKEREKRWEAASE